MSIDVTTSPQRVQGRPPRLNCLTNFLVLTTLLLWCRRNVSIARVNENRQNSVCSCADGYNAWGRPELFKASCLYGAHAVCFITEQCLETLLKIPIKIIEIGRYFMDINKAYVMCGGNILPQSRHFEL